VDTVWFGIKLGVGIVIGMALIRLLWREIMGFIFSRQFTKRACTFQHEGGSEAHPNGWMTRDPRSHDWILWDIQRNRMMRLDDEAPKSEPWRPSEETLPEFLKLAEEYNNWLNGITKPKQPVRLP
jgi:hypothetical protein